MSSGKSASRRAAAAQQEAVDELRGIRIPTIDEQKLFLEMLQQQGDYTPEMEAYLGELTSEAENIDPRLRSTQMESMDALRAIAEQGGYTDADQAAMRLYQRDAAAYDQAKQDQILQQMEQQGMGSSGNRLVAQLMSAQSAADRLARSGDEQLANALNRQLSATTQAAGLAGAITDQDMNRARQLDAIGQFNQQNQQALNQRNVASRNQAQQMNLAEKQRIADANVGTRNQQQQYNTGLAQQQFQNQMQRGQAVAGALGGQAQAYNQQAANQASTTGALIGGITGGLGAAFSKSDRNLKKNIEHLDSEKILDRIKGYTYDYKDELLDEDRQLGIMAQDLEKVIPQAVEDTPEGKVIDYNKMGGPIVGMLADINERLKKIEGK